MPHAEGAELVRINVFLSPAERDAFDKACRYPAAGGRRLSMTAAARELFRLFAEGRLAIDRERAYRLSRNTPEPGPPSKPRRTPKPPRRQPH